MASVTDPAAIAERRFLAALAERGARDPREFYRERLKTLRAADAAGFERAVRYFEETLIPEVAREASDPLAAWLEYGRVLADLCIAGETVQIDPTGRSTLYAPPVPVESLVLHLPTSTREAALAVGIPPKLSDAQRATYDLLVNRRAGSA